MTILTGVKNSLFFRRSTQVKKKNHFEDDLQVQCVRWFYLQYPKLDLFHIPNGGSRNRKISKKGVVYSPEATRFKAMGVRAGVPFSSDKGSSFSINLYEVASFPAKNKIQIRT